MKAAVAMKKPAESRNTEDQQLQKNALCFTFLGAGNEKEEEEAMETGDKNPILEKNRAYLERW